MATRRSREDEADWGELEEASFVLDTEADHLEQIGVGDIPASMLSETRVGRQLKLVEVLRMVAHIIRHVAEKRI